MKAWMAMVAMVLMVSVSWAAPTSKPVKMKWVLAEGASPVLQTVIDHQAEWRPPEIKRLTDQAKIKRDQIKKEKSKDRRATLRAEIELIEDRVDRIKRDLEIVVGTTTSPRYVGDVGCIRPQHLRVSQVVDESNAIVVIDVYEMVGRWQGSQQYGGVVTNLEKTGEYLAWLNGLDTTNWIDGEHVKGLGDVYAYCETTNDRSGQKMAELRPFTLDAFTRVPADD